jgi:hypothetical protein
MSQLETRNGAIVDPMMTQPPVRVAKSSRSVFALGDVHGDILSMAALQANGVIDIQGAWRRGGDRSRWATWSTVVRGIRRSSTEVTTWTSCASRTYGSRHANGGDVRCLFGNHELMNLAGVFAYPDEDMDGGLRCLPQGRSRRSDLRPVRASSSSRTTSLLPRRAGSDVFEAVATSRETLINGLLKAVVGSPMDVLMNRLWAARTASPRPDTT